MNVGLLLVAIGLLAVGGLLLLHALRAVEDRAATLERELTALAAELDTLQEHEGDTAQETRRAHVRLDNHHRQLKALTDQMGWADEHASTKLLTGTLPLPQPLPPKDTP